MAVLANYTFEDVNGRQAQTRLWVLNPTAALDVGQALATLSNAEIIRGSIITPLDITGLTNNSATADNVETVTQSARVTLGAAIGSPVGAALATVVFNIPAPVGDLINALSGDTNDVRLADFLDNVCSKFGIPMTEVLRLQYGR